jgi:class I fructose-bisphosphate aldolase
MLDMMVEAGVDAVILPLGSAQRYGSHLVRNGGPSLILRLDQTTMWREGTRLAYPDGHTRLVASVEDAVALGADAVITYLFFAPNDPEVENTIFRNNAIVGKAARMAGMVHIIETMGARHALATDIHDGDFVRMHTQIGIEMGADIIKTDWPGADALKTLTANAPIPIMLAGGPNAGGDRDTLNMVNDIMNAGAAGIMFGRLIFQAREPFAVMKACKAIIQDRRSVEDAIADAGFANVP